MRLIDKYRMDVAVDVFNKIMKAQKTIAVKYNSGGNHFSNRILNYLEFNQDGTYDRLFDEDYLINEVN